jgi:hypothetical protein
MVSERRGMRRGAWWVWATAWVWVMGWAPTGAEARADELHYEGFRYGQRALGMGGAVVAFPGEPESSYYNPASLAFVGGATFSGALQFYGLDTRTLRESFRTGRWLAPGDETSDGLVVLPSSSVMSKSFGEGDAHVVAASSFLVSHLEEGFTGAATQPVNEPTWRAVNYQSSLGRSDKVLMLGVTYGWRASRALALGASAYYARRDQVSSIQKGQTNERTSAAGVDFESFVDVSNRAEISDGALVLRVGALWAPSPWWSVGVGCSARSIGLHGDGALSYSLTASGDLDSQTPQPARRAQAWSGLEAQTVYPWGCRVGGVGRWPGRLSVSADVSAHASVRYQRLGLTDEQAAGAVVRSVLLNEVEKVAVVNAALGVEWWAGARWPVRAGFFSNRSAAPDIPAAPQALYAPQVNLYGVTLSGGYLGDDRSINLGVEAQLGSGYDVVVADLSDLLASPTFVRVQREETRVVFFLSGAFEFAQKTAEDLSQSWGED